MWLAVNKCGIALNKTQVQKILFICYGLYMVSHNECDTFCSEKLFTDDTPKAWPFGPVFPRSYKRYANIPITLTEEEKAAFKQDPDTLMMVYGIVERLCRITARDFTSWSHQEGTPWSKALFGSGKKFEWNVQIDDEDIYNYFKTGEWLQGLTN